MSLGGMLDKVGQHQRQTPAQDAIMGNNPTWSVINADFPCSLWGMSSSISRAFKRADIVGTHAIVTDSDLGVKAGDRVTVSGESGYFLVNGGDKFSNDAIGPETLYLIDATRRTV